MAAAAAAAVTAATTAAAACCPSRRWRSASAWAAAVSRRWGTPDTAPARGRQLVALHARLISCARGIDWEGNQCAAHLPRAPASGPAGGSRRRSLPAPPGRSTLRSAAAPYALLGQRLSLSLSRARSQHGGLPQQPQHAQQLPQPLQRSGRGCARVIQTSCLSLLPLSLSWCLSSGGAAGAVPVAAAAAVSAAAATAASASGSGSALPWQPPS